jgi:NADH:ubiquinone oxidoreductase subunit K
VVVICVSLIIHDVEHFLYTCESFVGLVLRRISSGSLPFYNWIVCFLTFEFLLLNINLSDVWFANIFSHTVSCVFIVFIVFGCAEIYWFAVIPFAYFSFCVIFGSYPCPPK